jgi:diguanylate cyclase (GGDEF)-like protein
MALSADINITVFVSSNQTKQIGKLCGKVCSLVYFHDLRVNMVNATKTRIPILWRAIAFVCFVCVALLLVDGWRSWNAYTVQIAQMRTASGNLAQAMATHADGAFKQADAILIGIAERAQRDGAKPDALARMHALMVELVAELPQLNGVFVYDENGKWLANSEPSLRQDLNNADREYFQFHRSHPGSAAHIGAPIISRSTGTWVIPVSRRIDHLDGSFGGVALATVKVEFFTSFYNGLEIGKQGAVALIMDSGKMVVRRPFDEGFLGKDMLGTDLYQAYRAQGPVGTAFTTSSQDGVARLGSFRRLKDYPLFVAAALSQHEILREWRRDTLYHSIGVLCLVGVVSMLGVGLIRQIDRRARTERALARAHDELQQANRTLARFAMQDGLTGLANRRQFDQSLYEAFKRAIRERASLALIMIDVDYFKRFNDAYGHVAGDVCLRAISQAVQEVVSQRGRDLTARFGGEEIAVLLVDADAQLALAVAQRILAAVRALGIAHAGNPPGVVTVSAGIAALAPQPGLSNLTALVQAADRALYEAKDSGRDRVCCSEAFESFATLALP